ncbi:hypothetical protein NHQ30_002635 [Ciborinia camelliae]|nr:hypothetical protein NHQ30_002635 [Ciborinia camelliae]
MPQAQPELKKVCAISGVLVVATPGREERDATRRLEYLDKRLFVQLNGSRKVIGVLRGYDVFLNIVLDDAVEEKEGGEKVKIGMVVCYPRKLGRDARGIGENRWRKGKQGRLRKGLGISRDLSRDFQEDEGNKIEDYIWTRAFTGYMKYKLHIEEHGRREDNLFGKMNHGFYS